MQHGDALSTHACLLECEITPKLDLLEFANHQNFTVIASWCLTKMEIPICASQSTSAITHGHAQLHTIIWWDARAKAAELDVCQGVAEMNETSATNFMWMLRQVEG